MKLLLILTLLVASARVVKAEDPSREEVRTAVTQMWKDYETSLNNGKGKFVTDYLAKECVVTLDWESIIRPLKRALSLPEFIEALSEKKKSVTCVVKPKLIEYAPGQFVKGGTGGYTTAHVIRSDSELGIAMESRVSIQFSIPKRGEKISVYSFDDRDVSGGRETIE